MDGCYAVNPAENKFAIRPLKFKFNRIIIKSILITAVLIIDLLFIKIQLFNKITVYENNEIAEKLIKIIYIYLKL